MPFDTGSISCRLYDIDESLDVTRIYSPSDIVEACRDADAIVMPQQVH